MKYTRKIAAILLAMIQITNSCFAQAGRSTEPGIDAIVDTLLHGNENEYLNNKKIIGAAIGIYWKGKAYYYNYGWADKERQIKVDTNTLFEIGSNTKVFTGLMLSSEITQGKISGDDYIDKYLDVNEGIKNKVRLTDIANHISGLPTFHDSASLAELIAKDTTKDPLMLVTDDYMLSVLQRVDTLHNFGKYRYSNFGFGVLGYILQKKEHAGYEQLLQQLICKPLQLKHTTSLGDTTSAILAKGYHRMARAPFINLCSAMQGAGSIKSNITDMVTFLKAQINENNPMQDAIRLSHKKYYNGENLQIAMGWHVSKMYGAELYEMRGDTYGASSLMLFDQQDNLGIAILLNSANSGIVQRSMNAIVSKLIDTSGIQSKYAQPEIPVDTKILESYIGTYELQPGLDATISIDSGKLAIQLTEQPKISFKAIKDNWFVLEKLNCQLEFIRNEKGVCNEFVIYQNGEKVSCNRK